MNLTKKIQDALDAENPPREPTEAEKKAAADFVADCRAANPYTKRFYNVTKQIRLAIIEPDTAALEEAARYEGIDDMRANPGMKA